MPQASVIGIDLGGTKIAIGRFDAKSFTLQKEMVIPTPRDGFPQVLTEIIKNTKELQMDHVTAIGIGVPGLVRQPEGIALIMPNIQNSHDIPIKKELELALSLPVTVDNDTNCFTLSEAVLGVGKGQPVVVGITFGTGVGGGIVLNGRIYHGHHGFAAEIGHMLLKPGEPPYQTDNKRGEVEQFLSGSAFRHRCAQATKPSQYLEGATCSFMHPDIHREVAWLCTSIIHLLDPSVIVFGGSAGHALKEHLPGIQHALSEWLLPGTPVPTLTLASLPNAGMLGAALLTKSLI